MTNAETDTPPALTAQEWADDTADGWFTREAGVITFNSDDPYHFHRIDNPRGLAAFCLYGQPFGFTRKDVETLWILAHRLGLESPVMAGRLDGLAARIAALLPPE